MEAGLLELAVALLLMLIGGYGMAQGLRALERGLHPLDIASQMPVVGIGVILDFLGCWMAAQALVSFHL